MKKLFLSIAVALASSSAMANILIESAQTPITPSQGDLTKYVRVYTSGEVQRVTCDSVTGVCNNTFVTTLSPYAVNHIYGLIAEARAGVLLETPPTCTDPATETHRYTADNGTILLETATYPCGTISTNNTDGADALLGIVKQYEF